jgi:hypothetical protein
LRYQKAILFEDFRGFQTHEQHEEARAKEEEDTKHHEHLHRKRLN